VEEAARWRYRVVLADLWSAASDHCRNRGNHAADRNHWDSGDWRLETCPTQALIGDAVHSRLQGNRTVMMMMMMMIIR
jgi:hypothetical protein